MSNVIESKIMQDHSRPVVADKLVRNMASHVVVDLSKVLTRIQLLLLYDETNS
jgi:hypothetical protein